MGTGRGDQEDARARGSAVRDQVPELVESGDAGIAGCNHEVEHVVLDLLIDVDLADDFPGVEDVLRVDDGVDLRQRAGGYALDDLSLLGALGVVDDDLEHEAVDLGLGQGVCALLFDGVLGRQDEEGGVDGIGAVADGDLSFLHGFEEGALDFGGCAVDLVGEDEVGEDGAFADAELAGAGVVDLCADEVSGQEVGGELDAREPGVDGLSDGLYEECLGEAGDAFEEDVAVGEQADEGAFDEPVLAYDGLANLGHKVVDERRLLFDHLVYLANAREVHHGCLEGSYVELWGVARTPVVHIE